MSDALSKQLVQDIYALFGTKVNRDKADVYVKQPPFSGTLWGRKIKGHPEPVNFKHDVLAHRQAESALKAVAALWGDDTKADRATLSMKYPAEITVENIERHVAGEDPVYFTQTLWKALNYIETVFSIDIDVHGDDEDPQHAKCMSGKIVRAASQRCVLHEASTHGKGIHLYMRMQIPECSKWNVDDEQFLKTVNCWPLAGQYKRCPSHSLKYVRAETLNALYRAIVRLVNVWAIQLGYSDALVDRRLFGGYTVTEHRTVQAVDLEKLAPHLLPIAHVIPSQFQLPFDIGCATLIKAPRTAGLSRLRPLNPFKFARKILAKLDAKHKAMWVNWVQDGVPPKIQSEQLESDAKKTPHKNKATRTIASSDNVYGNTELRHVFAHHDIKMGTVLQREKWESWRADSDGQIRHIHCCWEALARFGYMPEPDVLLAYYEAFYYCTGNDSGNRLSKLASARAFVINGSKGDDWTEPYSSGFADEKINLLRDGHQNKGIGKYVIEDYITGPLMMSSWGDVEDEFEMAENEVVCAEDFQPYTFTYRYYENEPIKNDEITSPSTQNSQSCSPTTCLPSHSDPTFFTHSLSHSICSPLLNPSEVVATYFDWKTRNIYRAEVDVTLFILSTSNGNGLPASTLSRYASSILRKAVDSSKTNQNFQTPPTSVTANKIEAILKLLIDRGFIRVCQKHRKGFHGRYYEVLPIG